MTERDGVLKEKVFTVSNQKGAQGKLAVKTHLATAQRELREHRHHLEVGVVLPHKMKRQGQQSATGSAERGGRQQRA